MYITTYAYRALHVGGLLNKFYMNYERLYGMQIVKMGHA